MDEQVDVQLMQKMGREYTGVRKGAWTPEEDVLLRKCVDEYGEGRWHLVPTRAGLRRCRKSCRLRWLNYLKPNIKKGAFGEDEVDLIIRLHRLLGNRWSLIAGRIPGRTANDIKNFWNSCLSKKVISTPTLQLGTVNHDSSNKETMTERSTQAAAEPDHLKQVISNYPGCHAAAGRIKETVRPSAVAPSHAVIKPQPRIPSKSFGFSICPPNNVIISTHREARREPSATDVDKEVEPDLPWLRNQLLGVLEDEEEDVDDVGNQKQFVVQEGRPEHENYNLDYSFPACSGGGLQAGEVDQYLVTGRCREDLRVGSDEGQWWWEDMFLDYDQQLTQLGDLLGPEVGTATGTYVIEGEEGDLLGACPN